MIRRNLNQEQILSLEEWQLRAYYTLNQLSQVEKMTLIVTSVLLIVGMFGELSPIALRCGVLGIVLVAALVMRLAFGYRSTRHYGLFRLRRALLAQIEP